MYYEKIGYKLYLYKCWIQILRFAIKFLNLHLFQFWNFQEISKISIFFNFEIFRVLSNILKFSRKKIKILIFSRFSKFHNFRFFQFWNITENFHFSIFFNFSGYARIQNFTTLPSIIYFIKNFVRIIIRLKRLPMEFNDEFCIWKYLGRDRIANYVNWHDWPIGGSLAT